MSVFNKIISFFCGDNIDKIRIRESTVMRNNQVHKLHKEIIDQLGDLATVVSRSYVYEPDNRTPSYIHTGYLSPI